MPAVTPNRMRGGAKRLGTSDNPQSYVKNGMREPAAFHVCMFQWCQWFHVFLFSNSYDVRRRATYPEHVSRRLYILYGKARFMSAGPELVLVWVVYFWDKHFSAKQIKHYLYFKLYVSLFAVYALLWLTRSPHAFPLPRCGSPVSLRCWQALIFVWQVWHFWVSLFNLSNSFIILPLFRLFRWGVLLVLFALCFVYSLLCWGYLF